jgi:hypothetical protein
LIFFENYEPPLLHHIHFRLPNASMRRELFAPHLPNPAWVEADDTILADPAKWTVTQAMVKSEIAKIAKGPRRIGVVVFLRHMHAYVPALATTHLHLRSSQIYGHTFLKSLE